MKILNIKINKVFSIGTIEQSLEDTGLVLITGYSKDNNHSNGSGKSSFVRNSLIWGLYGRLLSSNTGDDVINRHTDGKDAFVEITFEGVNGKTYKIKRSRNPQKLELFQVDGTRLSQKTGTQEVINTLLGRDFKTFIQTDFFGQGRSEAFLDLSSTNQREVVESILRFEEYDEWEKEAKRLRDLSEAEKIEQEKIIEKFKGKLEAKDVSTIEEKEIEWEKTMIAARDDAAKKLEILESQREEKKKILDNLNGSLNNLEIKDETDLVKISQEFNENKVVLEERLRKTVTTLRQVHSLESVCHVCSQPVSKEHLHSLETSLNSEQEELLSQVNSIGLERKKILEQILAIRMVKASADSLKIEIQRAESSLREIDYDIIGNQKKLKSFYDNQENPYTFVKQKILDEKKEVELKLSEFITHHALLEKEYSALDFWAKTYGNNMRIFFMEKSCPFLEHQANKYLELLNNSQLTVSFSTTRELKSGETREDFSVTVNSKQGGDNFSLLSGGEQQMINFAIGLALADLAEQQTSGSSQIMILDEPFTNLDPKNCENVINFITQHLQKRKKTILFVSNEENLKTLIPKRLHLIKQNGISELENV